MLTNDLRQELVNLFMELTSRVKNEGEEAVLISGLPERIREKFSLLSEEEQIRFMEWYTQTDTGAASGAGVGDRVFVEVIKGG